MNVNYYGILKYTKMSKKIINHFCFCFWNRINNYLLVGDAISEKTIIFRTDFPRKNFWGKN